MTTWPGNPEAIVGRLDVGQQPSRPSVHQRRVAITRASCSSSASVGRPAMRRMRSTIFASCAASRRLRANRQRVRADRQDQRRRLVGRVCRLAGRLAAGSGRWVADLQRWWRRSRAGRVGQPRRGDRRCRNGRRQCGWHRQATGETARRADACVVIPTVEPSRVTPHTEGLAAVVWHLLVSHPALRTQPTKWESLRGSMT